MNAALLWSRYLAARKDPDGDLSDVRLRRLRTFRDRLGAHYAPLAATVARRAAPKPAPPLDTDDVASWVMAGLLHAVETYAYSTVRWRVLDELRKADPLPRSARSWARAAKIARTSLGKSLGRAPTEDEIAASLGTEPRRLRDLVRREIASGRPVSLDGTVIPSDSTVAEAGPGLHAFLTDTTDDPQAALDGSEARERIVDAIGGLDEKSRFVVTAYFYRGMKLREIGADLGLTEGRISQILRAALDALRDDLAA